MRYGIMVTPQDYEAVCASGYDYVEFAGRQVAAMTDAQFDELKAAVDGGRKPCLGLNAYCPPEVAIIGEHFSVEIAREYAQPLAKRAHALGVQTVGVGSPFSRMLAPGFDVQTAWEQAVSFMKETSRAFAPYGITVCIEALGPCYCNFINLFEEAEKLRALADEENLKLVIDFYNMEHSQEADIPLSAYAGKIAHAHISDDAGSPRARSYLKTEKRDIHRARLARLKEQAGYDGCISVEIDVPFDAKAAEETLNILKMD